ncbi:MAG: PaaI family thioesterase [bacterium]|nr:PaaI family thioesterase [bacterium]
MSKDPHFTALETMFLSAPINLFYRPTISISDAECEIELEISDRLHHAAAAVHGSVYFHLLDSSAFFAANSLERDVFVLTTSFTTYLTRPVSAGRMRSVARVVNRNKTQFIVEAIVSDVEGREIGRGSGIFVRGKARLCDVPGYAAG